MPLGEGFADVAGRAEAETIERAVASCLAEGAARLTGFLNAEAADFLRQALQEEGAVSYRVYGGYRGASRVRFAIAPAAFCWDGFEPGISLFCVEGQAFLGEEMLLYLKAAGVQAAEIGDVFESGGLTCGVASSEAVARLQQKGADVRGVPASVSACDPSEIALPGQQARAIKATVSSLRLDAIAAAGFPASRTRLSQEIEVGRVKLNGKVCTDTAAKLKAGDFIVIRGRGRLTVDELGQKTARGRIPVRLSKYSVL